MNTLYSVWGVRLIVCACVSITITGCDTMKTYLSRLRSVCLRCSDLRLARALSGSSFLDELLVDSSCTSSSRWCNLSIPMNESRTPRATSNSISLAVVDIVPGWLSHKAPEMNQYFYIWFNKLTTVYTYKLIK